MITELDPSQRGARQQQAAMTFAAFGMSRATAYRYLFKPVLEP
jgi:hypothetical protein